MSVPLSFGNFYDENDTLFAEIAHEESRPIVAVAWEHYKSYVESIEDIDNDY